MIVVDLGCADRGEWFSLEALADRYKPDLIYGFDPSPTLNVRRRKVHGVPVKLEQKAAWVSDGTITFEDEYIPGRAKRIGVGPSDPSCGRVGTIGVGKTTVPCFDFSAWLRRHGPAVVKMDVEGAEYRILRKLLRERTARLVTELVIEWHDTADEWILNGLKRVGVPVTGWWM